MIFAKKTLSVLLLSVVVRPSVPVPISQNLHKGNNASLGEGVKDHNEFTFHKYLQEK